jgi:hypothetical protein
MQIDGCPHTFHDLARTVLPAYLQRLQMALRAPHSAALFAQPKRGPIAIAKTLNLPADFSGCYVLIEVATPIYVGISRGVLARLRQHFVGGTHFDASLAYMMAQRHLPTEGTRSHVMEQPAFKQAFAAAQARLQSLAVAFIEIRNPLELYLFEAYAAMELKTCEWNTFRTH